MAVRHNATITVPAVEFRLGLFAPGADGKRLEAEIAADPVAGAGFTILRSGSGVFWACYRGAAEPTAECAGRLEELARAHVAAAGPSPVLAALTSLPQARLIELLALEMASRMNPADGADWPALLEAWAKRQR